MSRGWQRGQSSTRGRGGSADVLRSVRGGIDKSRGRGIPSLRRAGAQSAARGGGRGAGRGGTASGGGGASSKSVQLIIPTVPPDYPPIGGKLTPLSNAFAHLTPWYNRTSQFFRSNYTVKLEKKTSSPFFVEKYTDSYDQPLKLESNLQYTINPKLLPAELNSTGLKKVRQKILTDNELRKKLEKMSTKEQANNEAELSDDETNTTNNDDDVTIQKKSKDLDDSKTTEKRVDDDEEEQEEEDQDDELDEGTDYLTNYFDNGEGYGHSDEEDDPNVY